ncbi:TrkH family potassium uptake protein [Vagococcus acidifermentans]|uniref:Ktr system potassium uptake protein D n=1 Tax=Vagococcus acidifermentans TaxID=564710 RepID=A0A430ALW6_9ENTE|nr:potassium transporter TrkG [Vagococcus acidifermentans]RSU09098.1 Ktr system potassium uptake protein D [Vagococcus acidifermentans]
MKRTLLFEKFRRRKDHYIATHFSSIQIIFGYYVAVVIVAFVLLSLPFFRNSGAETTLFDTLFMAISTVSVTGLSTFNISDVFNQRGIILLEILFQVGGLGIMMISTFFFILTRKRISLRQRQLIMTDMNQPKLSGSVRLIRTTMLILLWIQLLFGIFFSIHFYFVGHQESISDAIFFGFYEAISAVTNSGFDVTGMSAVPYANDYPFILSLIFLIMIGGIGFPVIMEVKEWLFYKRQKGGLPFRFSLFSRLAISAFIIFFIAGTLVIYALERNHLFQDMPEIQKWISSMFYAMSTRNAGLQINDLNDFQTPTLLIFSVLMFIGCSPSSVGGGVRTTTVAILGLYMLSFIKGEENVSIFGRRIDNRDIKKSIVVFNLSLIMCFVAVLILTVTEEQSFIAIVMEVASAFGTTGLSLGITGELTFIGKLVIAALMFIGRIGMLYTLMIFIPKEQQDKGYTFPTEKIIIG